MRMNPHPAGQIELNVPAVDGEKLPSLAPVLERVTPSVVNVYTQTRVRVRSPLLDDPFFRRFFNVPDSARERVSQSLGSGVIVDAGKGFVLTNNHVIQGADDISVTLSDGRSFDAEVIGTDPDTDLAMIRIPAEDLPALPFADTKALRVGDFVVAVGNPFGLGQTVTSGIVSALGRSAFRGLEFQNFIQTDASINPGNSGGPLLNLKGEVVGINTAIVASGQGIGFAIPINMADGIINQLKDSGEVSRGWLGVGIQDLTPELAEYYAIKEKEGVLVTQTYEGDPADKAGIKEGDVIVAVDGKRIASSRELSRTVAEAGVGNKMSLTVLRDGREKEIDVKLAKRPDTEPTVARGEARSDDLGLKVREIDPEIAERLGLDENTKGVVVTGVNPDSKAAEADIRQGDVVIEINRKPVTSLEDYKDQLRKIDTGETVQMLLRRGGGGLLAVKFKR